MTPPQTHGCFAEGRTRLVADNTLVALESSRKHEGVNQPRVSVGAQEPARRERCTLRSQ